MLEYTAISRDVKNSLNELLQSSNKSAEKYYFADNSDIEELSKLRVLQQKDDWGEEFTATDNLYLRTKNYLKLHLNNDLIFFVAKVNSEIVSITGLQILNLLPQCNDTGLTGFVCSVYTQPIDTKVMHQSY